MPYNDAERHAAGQFHHLKVCQQWGKHLKNFQLVQNACAVLTLQVELSEHSLDFGKGAKSALTCCLTCGQDRQLAAAEAFLLNRDDDELNDAV